MVGSFLRLALVAVPLVCGVVVSLIMRSVPVIVALGATLARGVPIEPRQFDFDFSDQGMFADAGNTLFESDVSYALGDSPVLYEDYQVADSSYIDYGTEFDPAQLDLASTDTFAPPEENYYYLDESGQVVSDVDSGLGAVDGDLIATGNVLPDTNQFDVDFIAPPEDLAAFAPTDAGLEQIAAIEYPDFGGSTTYGKFEAPPGFELLEYSEADTPGDWTAFDPEGTGALDIATSELVAPDSSLKPNLEVVNAIDPEDESTGTLVASVDGSLAGVEVPKAAIPLVEQLTLSEFKENLGTLAQTAETPEVKKYYEDLRDLGLTAKDFGMVQADFKFATTPPPSPNAGTPGGNANSNAPAPGPVNSQNPRYQLPPAVQNAARRITVPQQIRSSGPSFGQTLLTQGVNALSRYLIESQRASLYRQDRVTVGVPVRVTVAQVQTRIARVPPITTTATVVTTLNGGRVVTTTRVLVFQPTQSPGLRTSTRAGAVVAQATGPAAPGGAGVPRPSPPAGSPPGTGGPVARAPQGGGPARRPAGAPQGGAPARRPAGAPQGGAPARRPAGAPQGGAPARRPAGAPQGGGTAPNAPGRKRAEFVDALSKRHIEEATEHESSLPEDDYPPLVQQDAGAGNRGWNGILCPLGIFGDLYSTDSTAEKEDAAAKGCPTDVSSSGDRIVPSISLANRTW